MNKGKIIVFKAILLIICFLGIPNLAFAQIESDLMYLDENGDIQVCNNYTEVTEDNITWGEAGTSTWYVVKENVDINSRVTILGDVHLILCDGAILNALSGITVIDDNSFTVYAQSITDNMGELIATGHYTHAVNHYHSAGIGGTAQDLVGNITINGGKITATGGGYAAGIGGGFYGSAGGSKQHAYRGGNITITGGIVIATNEYGTSGIGSAAKSQFEWFEFQGVESNFSTGNNGRAIIKATSFILDNKDTTSWNGIIFEEDNGRVYGNQSLSQDLIIAESEQLTISNGSELSIPAEVTLVNNGMIYVEDGGLLNGYGTVDLRNGFLQGNTAETLILICKVNTSDLSNIISEGSDWASNEKDYSITLIPNDAYNLPENILVKVQGKELSSEKYTYDFGSGKLLIPAKEIVGNIDIIASAVKIPEYTVTINQVEGATITPNGVLTGILGGSSVDIEIKANSGYKIRLIKINDIEQALPLLYDILTIHDINENINVVVEVEKQIIENDNAIDNEENENNESIDNEEDNKEDIKEENNTNNPQTGDNIELFIGMLVMSVIGIVSTTKFMENK